jgi:phosphoribosyl 1,2-cyclic phosphodiesterase
MKKDMTMAHPPNLTIEFWGVRGSIPSPGATTVRYGGNTSCVSVQLSTGQRLILDAGTGMRQLGQSLASDDSDLFILLSHPHWDHIQGLPFFQPLYQPDRHIYIFPTPCGETLWCTALEQMDGAHFPVKASDLPSHTQCITHEVMTFLDNKGFGISEIATNHPGGSKGYRIEDGGSTMVYLTDNELEPPYAKTTSFESFVEFCWQADVLIHDAQYLESDMPHKHGWGHSLVSQVRELAAAAEVKRLVLFHHDPERTDDELDVIQEETHRWLQQHHPEAWCTAAFEGLTIDVGVSAAVMSG